MPRVADGDATDQGIESAVAVLLQLWIALDHVDRHAADRRWEHLWRIEGVLWDFLADVNTDRELVGRFAIDELEPDVHVLHTAKLPQLAFVGDKHLKQRRLLDL